MSSTNQENVTRRRFLQSLGVVGAVGASGSLLSACGGGGDSGGDESGGDAESSSETASGDCTDLSMLSDSEKEQRSSQVEALEYVEETPNEEENCANCSLYQEDKYDNGCGGCQLFPGPVTENGYCTSWAPAS
ncbi:MAG: high-potential iron-sulfur protein [Salinibacter sp.]